MRLSMQRRLTSRPLGNSSTPRPRAPRDRRSGALALGLGPVGGTHIDPEVLDLRDLLAVILVHDVNRLLADHAHNRTVAPPAPQARHALADEDLRIPSTDRVRS